MSKTAKVRMAEILHTAGFSARKVLAAVRYPRVESVTVNATAIDTHLVTLYIEGRAITIEGVTKTTDINIMPLDDYIESSVEHDGVDDWSITRSKATVIFSDNGIASLFFGNASTGPETDKRRPVTHRLSIPAAPSWPVPSFLVAKYPPPIA
jgi:hypothetical protein